MRSKRRLFQLLALLFAFALVAAACGDSDDDGGGESTDTTAAEAAETTEAGATDTTAAGATTTAADEAAGAEGGEAILAAEQWPECLNPITSCANASWLSWSVLTHVLPRAMELDIDNAHVASPVLVEAPTEENGGLVVNDDGTFTLTFQISPDAVWSDGTPITSEDFKFTVDAKNGTTGTLSTVGFDLVTNVDTSDPKTAVITFSEPFAAWADMFGGTTEYLLPAHAFTSTDIANDWLTEITVSGGPWVLESWSAEQAIFVPNENYWVEDRMPILDRVVIVPRLDTDTEVTALQTGEVMAAYPQPFPGAKDRLTDPITFVGGGGTFLEGLWINQQAPAENAGATAAQSKAVRQALAYALDRQQIADTALGSIIDSPEVLQCAGWNPTFGEWCDSTDFEKYTQDEAMVTQLLEADGWTRPDPNGLWQKDGQDLVLQWNTVAGNARREDVQALVVEMTRPLGIGWEIQNYDAGELFENRLPQLNFGPVALYANSTSPDPSIATLYDRANIPSEANEFSGQNSMAWDSQEATDLSLAIDREIDADARLELVHELGDLTAEDVPWIPLYLLPNLTVWRTDMLTGPVGDYAFHAYSGFANMYDWQRVG